MKKILLTLFLLLSFHYSNSQIQVSDSTAQLYLFLKEWWRVPYSWGGTTKKGVDCSAFVREMCEELHDKKLPRTSREQYLFTDRIQKDELRTGDLVFFKRSDGVWHVGYYLFDSLFAHSSSRGKGVSIGNLQDPHYSATWFSQGRVK